MAVNPLGFRSAIYGLAGSGTPGRLMHDVSDGLRATGDLATRSGTAASPAERMATLLGSARTTYSGTLDAHRRGVADEASVLDGLDRVRVQLTRAQDTVREPLGAVTGHVSVARGAAERVVASLRSGGAMDEAMHTDMWRLRSALDSGWTELGMSKVLGTGGPARPMVFPA